VFWKLQFLEDAENHFIRSLAVPDIEDLGLTTGIDDSNYRRIGWKGAHCETVYTGIAGM
jgi:hypothetical protein